MKGHRRAPESVDLAAGLRDTHGIETDPEVFLPEIAICGEDRGGGFDNSEHPGVGATLTSP